MASSSATSSANSSLLQNSASDEDQIRKRKRMISNRESARRSRMRKQKHLDDLTAEVAQLRSENQRIIANLSVTSQRFVIVEAENLILRARVAELAQRLRSLEEIVGLLNAGFETAGLSCEFRDEGGEGLFDCLQMPFYMNQPLMASADMFQDY